MYVFSHEISAIQIISRVARIHSFPFFCLFNHKICKITAKLRSVLERKKRQAIQRGNKFFSNTSVLSLCLNKLKCETEGRYEKM